MPSEVDDGYIKGMVDAAALRPFLTTCFVKAGLKKAHADEVTDQLVNASLRGVDTHGAVLTQRYVDAIKSGEISANPRIRPIRVSGSIEVLDGDFGAGQYVAMKATKDAIALASKNGIGTVWVVNMSHCGMLAHYGLMIAQKRMAGLLFTNSNAGAAPLGGREKVFGTNPLCFAFPHNRFHIVFDGATTAVAGMKIELARMEGKKIPLGWALDADGNPTTDPTKASMMLPFGGHKGYALMLMVEIFSSVLSGGRLSRELKYKNSQGGLYVQAIDIEQARKYAGYDEDLERLVGMIKSSARPDSAAKVYLPGEIEHNTSEMRMREGIPIHKGTWDSLTRIATEFAIELPDIRKV